MNTTHEQRRAAAMYIEKHAAAQATFPSQFILGLIADVAHLQARIDELSADAHHAETSLENSV